MTRSSKDFTVAYSFAKYLYQRGEDAVVIQHKRLGLYTATTQAKHLAACAEVGHYPPTVAQFIH